MPLRQRSSTDHAPAAKGEQTRCSSSPRWLSARRVLPHFGHRRTSASAPLRGLPYALTGFGSARRSASFLGCVTSTNNQQTGGTAMNNINRVVITGNLTDDPELRSTPSGTAVCDLRVACNTRRKDGEEWVDKPNYFNVTVWGGQGESVARYLTKGRPRRGRRAPGVARVGDPGRQQAPGREHHRRLRSVPGQRQRHGTSDDESSRCRPASAPRRTSSSRADGPRPDRGAGHKPNGQGHDHEPTPSHRPHSRKPRARATNGCARCGR